VGGTIFRTSRSTLLHAPGSMLSNMFSPSLPISPAIVTADKNTFFIDRDPTYFRVILNYLRTGRLVMDQGCSADGILAEARYFGIREMEKLLEGTTQEQVLNVGGTLFSTTSETLCCFSGCVLSSMFLGEMEPLRDKHGNIFIDEDPGDFVFVLKSLRSYKHSTANFLCFSHGPGERYSDTYDPVKVPPEQLESVTSLAARLCLPSTTGELFCTNVGEDGSGCNNKWNRVSELFTRDDGYLGIYRPKVAEFGDHSEMNGVS